MRRLLALVLLLGAVGACGGDNTESTLLTASDDLSTQTIHVGDTIVIHLETAGGSGYSWTLNDYGKNVVKLVSQSQAKKDAVNEGDAPIVGAPEIAETVLEGVAAGKTTVLMHHVPPGGGAPEDTFSIEIVVKK